MIGSLAHAAHTIAVLGLVTAPLWWGAHRILTAPTHWGEQ